MDTSRHWCCSRSGVLIMTERSQLSHLPTTFSPQYSLIVDWLKTLHVVRQLRVKSSARVQSIGSGHGSESEPTDTCVKVWMTVKVSR